MSNIDHVRLVVPVDDIMRLKPFISTEETRYYLNGVRFERGPEGTLLIATDGHRLGVFNSKRAMATGEGIVRLPVRWPKVVKDHRQWLIVGTYAGTELALVKSLLDRSTTTAEDVAELVTLANTDAIYPQPMINGDFPDWRRVVPGELGPRSASFNTKYLADWAAAGGGKRGEAITLHGAGLGEPHVVSVGTENNFIGVQMPMRADGLTKFPSWFEKSTTKRRKAA